VTFALTLLGVALWHHRTLEVATTGLFAITLYKLTFGSFRDGVGLDGLLVTFHTSGSSSPTWDVCYFALLSRHFEKSHMPDWVIRAQFGHVSPAMMAIYSHVRRKALDDAAHALEPDGALPTSTPPASSASDRVMSQVTSQPRQSRSNVLDFSKKTGGPSRTRNHSRRARRVAMLPDEVLGATISHREMVWAQQDSNLRPPGS
jgi:hypothetical protein